MQLNAFEEGFLVGILAGEGHFGGDGRQPHITLRMHTRHLRIFDWLQLAVPEGRLYGPYFHGGRQYYQWMIRGRALRETLAPLFSRHLEFLDDHIQERFLNMCSRYGILLPDPDEPIHGVSPS